MERRIYNEKTIVKCVCMILAYIFSTLFLMYRSDILLKFFERDTLNVYLDLFYYSAFALAGIIMFRKEFVKCFKDFGKNAIDRATLTGIIFIVALLLIAGAGAAIDKLFDFGQSENQSNIDEWVEQSKVISMITIIFIGPLAEELVFRGCFFGIIRGTGESKVRGIIAIIIGGAVFGMVHMSHITFQEFVMCVPLMLEGTAICFLYYKTDNILCPMIVHMGMNALASK